MPDVLGSFQRGYNLGSSIIGDMDRRDRQKTLQEREDTQWQQSQEDRTQRLADVQTARERDETTWQQQQEDRKTRLSDAADARSWNKKQQGRQEIEWKRSDDQFNREKGLQERADLEDSLVLVLGEINRTGKVPDKLPDAIANATEETWANNPHLSVFRTVLPSEQLNRKDAIKMLGKVANGEQISPTDPQLLKSVNSIMPEIVQAANLPKYIDGKKVVGRELSAVTFLPDKGGLVFSQNIELEDGTVVQNAPVTINRSDDLSDDVVVTPINTLTDRLGAQEYVNNLPDDVVASLNSSYIGNMIKKSNRSTDSVSDIQKTRTEMLDQLRYEWEEMIRLADGDEERIAEINNSYGKSYNRLQISFGMLEDKAKGSDRKSMTNPKDYKEMKDDVYSRLESLGFTLTPELRTDVNKFIRNNHSLDEIMTAIPDYYFKTGKEKPESERGSGSEDAESVLDSILNYVGGTPSGQSQSGASSQGSFFGKPTQTATGAQTTTGGRLYNVGNELLVPNKVNPEQAAMTPYQQRQRPTLSDYNYARGN